MAAFSFTREKIDEGELRKQLQDPAAGGYASFEGWVRNHNEGLPVRHLEYEAFEPLAIKEGERIVAEAIKRFGIEHAACVHRIGDLAIGEMAVWVGVSARHRAEAFAPADTSSTKSNTACPSGRRSTTRTATPVGSTANAAPHRAARSRSHGTTVGSRPRVTATSRRHHAPTRRHTHLELRQAASPPHRLT